MANTGSWEELSFQVLGYTSTEGKAAIPLLPVRKDGNRVICSSFNCHFDFVYRNTLVTPAMCSDYVCGKYQEKALMSLCLGAICLVLLLEFFLCNASQYCHFL